MGRERKALLDAAARLNPGADVIDRRFVRNKLRFDPVFICG
jgi:hypothetical protein